MTPDEKTEVLAAIDSLRALVVDLAVEQPPQPPTPLALGSWDHSRSKDGVTGIDTELAAILARPRTVNQFRRGYTSGGHPASFADSPVRVGREDVGPRGHAEHEEPRRL